MPRYRSRVGKGRRAPKMKQGGNIDSGGGVASGGSLASAALGSGLRTGGSLMPFMSHLHAAHSVLHTPRKTWNLVQHAAALHAGDPGNPLYPGITARHVRDTGLTFAKTPRAAYRDIIRGSRHAVAQGLMEEGKDHRSGAYRGAGLAEAVQNAMKTVHGIGKKGLKHAKTFAKHAPKHWRRFKNTLDKADKVTEHAGAVMEATHEGFTTAAEQYAEAGLYGSEKLKEELLPSAQEYYDSVKGIQEAARGVTSGAVAQAHGTEEAVRNVVDPIRSAIQEPLADEDLFG